MPPEPDGRQLFLEGYGGDTSNAAIAAAQGEMGRQRPVQPVAVRRIQPAAQQGCAGPGRRAREGATGRTGAGPASPARWRREPRRRGRAGWWGRRRGIAAAPPWPGAGVRRRSSRAPWPRRAEAAPASRRAGFLPAWRRGCGRPAPAGPGGGACGSAPRRWPGRGCSRPARWCGRAGCRAAGPGPAARPG